MHDPVVAARVSSSERIQYASSAKITNDNCIGLPCTNTDISLVASLEQNPHVPLGPDHSLVDFLNSTGINILVKSLAWHSPHLNP